MRKLGLVLWLLACGGPLMGGGTGGGSAGAGGGSVASGGGSGGGTAAAGGAGGAGQGGGSGGAGAGGAGGGAHVCNGLGGACMCPDAGTRCTSMAISDPDFAWCIHGTCTTYCNAPTQMQRDALCPMGFRCVDYAFGNEPSSWQCRR